MKVRLSTSVLFLFLLFISHQTKSQTEQKLKKVIDTLLRPWETDRKPGLSVAVVKEGKLIYSNGVGMANIKANFKNDSSTQFWIASVTKQFTAAAIYKLVVDKKIAVDKSITAYLPELPQQFNDITVNHLIHHTSGVRDGFVLTALSKNPPSEYTNENVIHYLKASQDLNSLPGTRYEYNNSGYVLLAALIDRISGKTYAAFMQDEIFAPIGMKSSYVSPSFPNNKKQAEGYKENGPNQFDEYHFQGNSYGSTGIVTTLADLVKWCQYMQQPARVPSLTRIPDYLLKAGQLNGGKPISYGGGLEKFKYKGRVHYEHFGADEGFKADILYFPSTKVSIIGLANNDSYYGLLPLLYTISDLVHGTPASGQKYFDENKPMISESFYYNSDVPKFVRIQKFGDYFRVSSALSGYAPMFQLISDTLNSFDPIPVQYLQKPNAVQSIDPYYHNNYILSKVQPNSRTEDIEKFSGQYYSKELNTEYKIIADGNGLHFEFIPGVVFDFYRLTDTDFMFEYVGPNYVQFSDKGFLFSREGCRKLKLEKR